MNKKNIRLRVIAFFIATSLVYEISFPTCAWALTGGPSQPEVQSFEPVGTTEMVDLFSGDFNYNIPLMDVGGYPINISYHSGITMDQEASWTGLGWNINPGVINRNMRGLPDDFNKEPVKKEFTRKPNVTFGADLGLNVLNVELFGLELGKVPINFGINYNNYKGINYSFRATPSLGIPGTGASALSVGLGYGSEGGFDVSPSLGFGGNNAREAISGQSGLSFSVGTTFNSRSGMKSLNYGTHYNGNSSSGALGINASLSASHNFGVQTWVPSGNIPSRSLSVVRSISAGADIFGTYPDFKFTASVSLNALNSNSVTKPAFGYLYEEKGYRDFDEQSFKDKTLAFISSQRSEQKSSEEANDVLLDFNREKDNSYSKNSTNLPLTNHTYDAYSVSGQGISGSYRFHRSDFGIVHDDFSRSSSSNNSVGAEIGIGNLAHNGGNISFVYNTNKTGLWIENNSFKDYINFVAKQEIADPLYEPAYLKAAGEMLPVDKTHFEKIHTNKTIRPVITDGAVTSSFFVKEGIVKSPTVTTNYDVIKLKSDKNVRTKRDPRNQLMTYLTAEEAQKFAIEKNIKSVAQGATHDGIEFANDPTGRINDNRKAHHLSEISVTKDDGSRYIYGIPAYNNKQIEKTFNVACTSGVQTSGMISYFSNGSNPDNSLKNNKGVDQFYSSTELPAYAHSYLLTGILSPDYVDLRGDGITEDDFGTGVKFNYTQTHSAYKWRVPYGADMANHMEGLQHTFKDDKGAYNYGEKEIWLMHSVETKTHIALFITSDREDCMQVAGENGGQAPNTSGNKLKKLDKIILYSKIDYLKNPQTAIPIKVVHFEYDYSTCPNIENNTGVTTVAGNTAKGKLTLKTIYFTYGKSNRGRTTPYKFTYSSINPGYNLKGYDRWGSYKPNTSSLPNNVYPFTSQNKATADEYANAWNLTEVFLPSGGKIKVEYEADDYAYVQNKQAMQMLKIVGFGKLSDKNIKGPITFSKFLEDGMGKNHYPLMFFQLQRAITGSNPDDTIKQKYLNGLKNIQFTVFADIDNNNHYEFVKGYAEIDWEKGGGGVSANGQYGWVALKMVEMGDKFMADLKTQPISPVAKSIWNYAKLNTPDLNHPYTDGEGNEAKKAALRLISILPEFLDMIMGYNFSRQTQNFGRVINTDKSFLRLNSPYKMKLGGGHRVKRIVTNDNWSQMGTANTDPENSEYGTEYSYIKEEKQPNGETMNISSGVASYEPTIGGDENPFVQPRPIVQKNICVPDETYLQEEPFGESFFPSPYVGYSKVTVRSISSQGEKRNGAGYKVNEFFTDYDYPTILKETEIDKTLIEPEPIWSLFQFKHETTAKVAQGYTIELNDMSGKPKSEFTYAEGSTSPISGAKYIYKTDTKLNPQRVDSKIPTISKTGQIIVEEVGVEYDFVTDMRESRDKTWNAGIGLNIETFIVGIFPMVVPVILPSYSEDNTQFNSAVSTKVIKRYGILTETIAYQEGASISSKNLLWDRETGQVLLSSTQNEFEDNIYSYNQPAHWAYEGMGHAYKNCDLTFDGVTISSTGATFVLPNSLNVNTYFVPGDECMMINGDYSQKVWVYKGTDNILNLIDETGDYIHPGNGSFKLKILRSGRRNMPTASVGSITTLKNPLSVSGSNYSLQFNNVLNTEAMEYKDKWQSFINYQYRADCTGDIFNGFKDFVEVQRVNKDFFAKDSIYRVKNGYKYYIRELEEQGDGSTLEVFYPYSEFGSVASIYKKNADLTYTLISNKDSETGLYKVSYTRSKQYLGNSSLISSNSYLQKLNSDRSACENFQSGTSIRLGITQEIVNEAVIITSTIQLFNTSNDLCPSNCSYTLEFPKGLVFRNIKSFSDYDFFGNGAFSVIVEVICADNSVKTVKVKGQLGCPIQCQPVCLSEFYSEPVNPFITGLEGNWRAWKSFKFLEGRNYNSTRPDVRNDGIYSSFTPYWALNSSNIYVGNTTNSNKWVKSSEVTRYSPFGNEMEDKDALDKYSSALFGYNFTQPIATSNNSKLGQIGYDGFEDYPSNYMEICYVCPQIHWNFSKSLTTGAELVNTTKHSGNFSLKVPVSMYSELLRPLVISDNSNTSFNENLTRILRNNDDLGIFSPTPGKYILGAWAKETADPFTTTFTAPQILVTFKDAGGNTMTPTYSFSPSGKIIEGWQRISTEFEVPAGAVEMRVKLNNVGNADVWFDDIRVQPFDGNMKSYAYDYRSNKLMAELDENNYATFYEYDQEGTLIRVKKETVNGIVTLKEARNHYFKK